MKLTKPQIENLFKFTRQHYVEWYDLQCELVDHLADDIEQIWTDKPNLTFKEARDMSFKKFGIYGFMDVVEQRQKALHKKYRKLIWSEFKKYFRLPKIILTVLLIMAFIGIFKFLNNDFLVLNISLAILIVFPIYFMIRNHKEIKKRQEKTGKKWLFEDSIKFLGEFGMVCIIPSQLFNTFQVIKLSENLIVISSIFIVLYGISMYIATVIIPKQVKKIIAKENPEYQIIL